MQFKIGIISDLHCHNLDNNDKTQESYILTDVEVALFQDPNKSFKKFLKENPDINVDILLAPGDFANKCDSEGLKLGWNITKELGKLLKAQIIIPNIGNHDVDSRNNFGLGAFHHIKNLSKDFPFQDPKQNDFFWEKGYIILEQEHIRVVVINTVHNHVDVESAKNGLISQEAINELEVELAKIDDEKLNIAMCHHNPIEHSHFGSGSKDFMHNGDELIALLDKFNFDMIIHGHKHDPRIRYAQGGSNPPVIFSSGSFSAFKTQLLQGAMNAFHIISFETDGGKIGKGIIDTWFFIPTKGWMQGVKNNYFESRVGFGALVDLKTTANEILLWFQQSGERYCEWTDLLNDFPDLNYVIPSDIEKLKGLLKSKNILISPTSFNEPTFVHFKLPK
ncbi:metallophosphoesterase [Pedobacter sp. Leaf194]|uniref:metallophosphoesterase family protein n=1 Tax=Pedobacter sp. Leaf194 TaxID=1736297 RepID=UPI000702F001|nr:metallophosphoesterase [Pedobacter sp. Leaf194]KQS36828.1 hypothetical protein ASG14_07260 [Pedobacter sp. Leaf194]